PPPSLAPTRRPLRRLVVGKKLYFVAVVVVTNELQKLRSGAGLAADQDLLAAGFFELGDVLALLIEQVMGAFVLYAHFETLGVLAVDGELQETHHLDGHALAGLDVAGAGAVRTFLVDAAFERRADALAGHRNQAELRHPQDFRAGAIAFHGLAESAFDAA